MQINKIYILFFILLIVSGCDTTSNIREPIRHEVEVVVRAVYVPYKTPYGPKIAKNMMAGSVDQAPVKSYYKKGEKLPAPSAFGCLQSWVNTNPDIYYDYNYQTLFMYFPTSLIKSARGQYTYVVSRALSPSAPDGELMGIRRCIMPNIQGIEKMVEAYLRIDGEMITPKAKFSLKTTSRKLDPDY